MRFILPRDSRIASRSLRLGRVSSLLARLYSKYLKFQSPTYSPLPPPNDPQPQTFGPWSYAPDQTTYTSSNRDQKAQKASTKKRKSKAQQSQVR